MPKSIHCRQTNASSSGCYFCTLATEIPLHTTVLPAFPVSFPRRFVSSRPRPMLGATRPSHRFALRTSHPNVSHTSSSNSKRIAPSCQTRRGFLHPAVSKPPRPLPVSSAPPNSRCGRGGSDTVLGVIGRCLRSQPPCPTGSAAARGLDLPYVLAATRLHVSDLAMAATHPKWCSLAMELLTVAPKSPGRGNAEARIGPSRFPTLRSGE